MKRIIVLAVLALVVSTAVSAQIYPTVTGVFPKQNWTHAYANTDVRITFSHSIESSSLNGSTIVVYGSLTGYHTGSISWFELAKRATFNPAVDFALGELVTVTVTTGVRIMAGGNNMQEPFVWNFIISPVGGSGTFATADVQYTSQSAPGFIQAADLDGDSNIDLATIRNYPDYNLLTTWINDGSGEFTGTNRETDDEFDHFDNPIPVDIDWDNDMDLMVEFSNFSSGGFSLTKINNPFTTSLYPSGLAGADYLNSGYAVTDFNGDGYRDAVQSYNDVSFVKAVRVLIYDEYYSSFTAAWTHTTEPNIHDFPCVADFNNDGKIDFATTNEDNLYISVWINNGGSSFSSNVNYSAGRATDALYSADLNGDGYADLVTVNRSFDDVSVLLNNGNGTFGSPSLYDTDVEPNSMVLVDLDDDGDLDIATANPVPKTVTVLLNDGFGDFSSSRTEFSCGQTNRSPGHITAGDFDGDGDMDLATSNGGYYSSYIYVLFNIAQPQVVSTSPGMNDIDVDPSPDITVTFDMDMDGATIDSNSFIVNTRTDGFAAGSVSYDNPSRTATFNPTYDFDEGEFLTVSLTHDIESAEGVALQPYVWSFTARTDAGSAGFNADVTYGTGVLPRYVLAADLNGDGHLDLAVANRNSHYMSILINNGDGTYASHVTYPTGQYPLYLSAADLDDDGDVDIAVANSGDDDISILKNYGNGTFYPRTDYPTENYPSSIHGGDMDGDGDIDLVTGCGSNVAVLLNSGTGAFPSYESYHTGSNVSRAYILDANNDGALDVAAVQVNTNSVVLMMNSGYGTLAVGETVSTGDDPGKMCAADFDGDGDLDMAVTNRADDNITYIRGGGNGYFSSEAVYATGDGPVEIVAADFDADGDMDLAAANYTDQNVSILINSGAGTFSSGGTYGAGGGTFGLFSADLDGNGTMDLVTTNLTGNSVSVLLNIDAKCATMPITATSVDIPFVVGDETIAVLNFISETLDSVNICVHPGETPPPAIIGTDWVQRYYVVTPYPGAAIFEVDMTLFYEQAEFGASGLAEEGALYPYRYDVGDHHWIRSERIVDTHANSICCLGVTEFSTWGFSDTEFLVDDEIEDLPVATALYQNYPNPFNPATQIRYYLNSSEHVSLSVYDVLGRLVTTLVDGKQDAGYRTVAWNGQDHAGGQVSSGVYFYKLVAGDFVQTRKMVLLR